MPLPKPSLEHDEELKEASPSASSWSTLSRFSTNLARKFSSVAQTQIPAEATRLPADATIWDSSSGRTPRLREDQQPLQSKQDEEGAWPCFPDGELPQALKDDLDSIPAPSGTSRRGKAIVLGVLLSAGIVGVLVLAFYLEHLTRGRAAVEVAGKARADWFSAGAQGLPPGYCEEHAMVLPHLDEIKVKQWARNMVSQMTEEEKYRLTSGVGYEGYKAKKNYYVGSVLGVPRLGIPSIKMQDGSAGFRTMSKDMIGQVTSWPCSLAAASSFDPDLVREWAAAMGKEFRAKGANMVLGPSLNVLRMAFGGRNAESLSGEDPTLGRILAPAYVKGMQEDAGVAVALRNFIGDSQETHKTDLDVHMHSRVRWERYYPPFESAIRAGAAAVVCSYNKVNGEQACGNLDILDDLKSMMGFEGPVISSWWAIKDGLKTAGSGTDIDMPGNDGEFSKLKLNRLDPLRLDEMVERTLIGIGRSGAWSNLPGDDCRVGCNCDGPLYRTVATKPEHVALARKVAAAGIVLLKNADSTNTGQPVLPLQKTQKVAVVGGACGLQPNLDIEVKYGWTSSSYYWLGGSSRVLPTRVATLVDGLKRAGVDVHVSPGDNIAAAEPKMKDADLIIVCGGATATETADRPHLRLDQDDFVSQVTFIGSKMKVPVVVVAYAPGAILTPWRHQASGLLLVFPSGQTSGDALADLLVGEVQPSAKLPLVLPAQESDAMFPCQLEKCDYPEGLNGGWHLYDGKPVAYPFGFGLSYTTFEYTAGNMSDMKTDGSRTLEVTVKNVGNYTGRETLQLYMRFPITSPALAEEPNPVLRRFAKTKDLQPGESQKIIFELGPRDLMVWQAELRTWRMIFGVFSVGIGSSSRDLRLCGAFGNQLNVARTAKAPMTKCPDSEKLPIATPKS
eukprot:TRINITY_DN11924_c0_g3_i1.p1 TRINITY_DN11924_c0_g3~~TRINITY_DN11924_c0_g3_i1.p1  ORF type:complete len:901 (-),score=138.15 TRINITY_DN11924_c0_g3_i1:32-2734(-)